MECFRDTQTVQQRHQVQQTTNAMSTQMTKIGVYVSNMEDKLVVPGQYTTAAEHNSKMLENVGYYSNDFLIKYACSTPKHFGAPVHQLNPLPRPPCIEAWQRLFTGFHRQSNYSTGCHVANYCFPPSHYRCIQ